MKALKSILIAVMVIATTTVFSQEVAADLEKTKIKWEGKKVTGEHWGYIKLKSGKMHVENDMIKSGTFIIDMNSIDCQDLTNKMFNKRLVNHLKSDDFFSVETYPEAKLKIKESSKFMDGKADVKGELTIRGKTNPIEFTAIKDGNKYTASITVDRSKYDVKYRSKSFFDDLGDKMIYDDFTLDVELATK